jgi:hypothetical protein
MQNQNDFQKKPAKRKYIIPAVVFLLMIASMVYIYVTQKPTPDPASEKVICEAVAKLLQSTTVLQPERPISPNFLK